MMKKLLLLLLLLSPFVQAADWLSWRTVGKATLTWGPFTVYDSQLLTPNGRWQPQQWPVSLMIVYRRDISRQALLDATLEQWQAQKTGSSSQQQQWLQQLSAIWPDVSDGARLAFTAGLPEPERQSSLSGHILIASFAMPFSAFGSHPIPLIPIFVGN